MVLHRFPQKVVRKTEVPHGSAVTAPAHQSHAATGRDPPQHEQRSDFGEPRKYVLQRFLSGGGEPRREEEEEELDLHYKVVKIGILVEEAQTVEASCSDKSDGES